MSRTSFIDNYLECFLKHIRSAAASPAEGGILTGYDFSPFKTIADIGGGRGHLLKAVLDATPDARGVLFDQPHCHRVFEGRQQVVLAHFR